MTQESQNRARKGKKGFWSLYSRVRSSSLNHQEMSLYLGLVNCKCAERRFSDDLEMKTRGQNRNNERTEIERVGWLSESSDEKNFTPEELSRNQSISSLDVVILQHNWPIEQCFLHFRVFFGGKKRETMFWSLQLLADKTNNNEHLPKPFFKVIRELLYRSREQEHVKQGTKRNKDWFILFQFSGSFSESFVIL